MLHGHGVAISMDGRGCWHDNVFVERLWRSIKYEEVYLHAYESVSAAKAGVDRYLEFYNGRRPNTALGDRTPDGGCKEFCVFEPYGILTERRIVWQQKSGSGRNCWTSCWQGMKPRRCSRTTAWWMN